MLTLHRLASVLVVSSGLALAGCGGGGATNATSSSMTIAEDGADAQCGREGVPRTGAPAASEAYVEIEHRVGLEPAERFRVEVTGLPIGAVVDVWLESPVVTGLYAIVGTLVVGDGHEGVFELSTADGEVLPYGALTVTSLAGLDLELRNPMGLVLFAGAVPSLGAR